MKKKVVHITTVHPPFDTRIFYKECSSLEKSGFEVYLIFTESNDYELKKFQDYNIKPLVIKKESTKIKRITKGTKSALEEALKLNADVYHIHDPELLLITRKLRKSGATVIYDMHEDYYTSIIQKRISVKPLRILIAKIFRVYEKIKIKKLKLILAENYYEETYPDGVKILNYPIVEKTVKNIAYTNNKKLLYTGNVTVDRGAFIHSEIPSYMTGIQVKFVGKCDKELANKMKQISGGYESIIINGVDQFISREEIDNEYNNEKWLAGLAIFPPTKHYMEKELTKFFEYMYAGLPIIVSDFPKWKGFVEKYQCGISVKYNDKDSIKNAINYLIDNPKIAKEMGENGQKAIVENLNWNKESEKLIKLYNSFS